MKVVVYAIAKDESRFAERWMRSMSEADSVVVLDTGSTDGTVEALEGLGATVSAGRIDPWRFDVARNASLDLAMTERPGILVCTDLDETLSAGWRDALEGAWRRHVDETGRHPTTALYRYVWSFNADGTPDRFFDYEKIHAPGACRWVNMVHEVLEYRGEKITVRVPGITLEHHPDPGKSRAGYLGLLEADVRANPENARNAFYLGREYMFHGMDAEAVEALKRYLRMPAATWAAERAAAMRFIGRCLLRSGDPDAGELWLRRACDEDPSQREAPLELAKHMYERRDWRGLVAACERCVSVERPETSYLVESESWGSLPWDLLSIGLWNVGDRGPRAARAFRSALSRDPRNPRLLANARWFLGGDRSSPVDHGVEHTA